MKKFLSLAFSLLAAPAFADQTKGTHGHTVEKPAAQERVRTPGGFRQYVSKDRLDAVDYQAGVTKSASPGLRDYLRRNQQGLDLVR